MPIKLREIAASKLWEKLPGTHPKSKGARIKRMLATINEPAAMRYDGYMRLFDERTLSMLTKQSIDDASSKFLIHAFESLSKDRDVVQTAMAVDRVTYLPDDLLTKVDRAAMLHALEVRSPFMDSALVTFAAGLSTQELLGTRGGATAFMQTPMSVPAKRLLREAFADELPATVFKRPKMGFAVPIGEWFRGELGNLLRDALTSTNSFAKAHFSRPAIEHLMDEHHAGRADHSQRLYALLMLELWKDSAGK